MSTFVKKTDIVPFNNDGGGAVRWGGVDTPKKFLRFHILKKIPVQQKVWKMSKF